MSPDEIVGVAARRRMPEDDPQRELGRDERHRRHERDEDYPEEKPDHFA